MSSAVSKKSQENMNQKIALVIKSGKFKLGKHHPSRSEVSFNLCYRLQVSHQVSQTGSIKAHHYC